MGTDSAPVRFRRGFCIDAAVAFAEVVSLRTANAKIDSAIASARRHFSTAVYDVEWDTNEKYAWLFVIALEDAETARRAYWLEYVRCRAAQNLNLERANVA